MKAATEFREQMYINFCFEWNSSFDKRLCLELSATKSIVLFFYVYLFFTLFYGSMHRHNVFVK
jgi:hypothetical protein